MGGKYQENSTWRCLLREGLAKFRYKMFGRSEYCFYKYLHKDHRPYFAERVKIVSKCEDLPYKIWILNLSDYVTFCVKLIGAYYME